MNTRPAAVGTLLLIALGAAVVPGASRAEPHVRNGWYAGIGYGGCWGNVDVADTQESQWSGTLNLRAGYALDQDLLLGVEYMRWAKGYDLATLQGNVPVDVALTGTVLAVSYFPGNAGFMLRGGLGVAVADVDVDDPPQDFPVQGIEPDPGLAAMVSMGYELRLTTTFALGAEADLLYLDVSDDAVDSASVYGVNVQFNWYW